MTYDKLLAALDEVPNPTAEDAAAAIRALLAERDEARARLQDALRQTAAARDERERAHREIRRLIRLLREARAWVANGRMFAVPGTNDLLARIDAALATEDKT